MVIRRTRAVDPRTYRISPHFVLSDFLGCHSVYSRGYKNPFVFDDSSAQKLANLEALCLHGLEPIMAEFGPLSVGYGYISPELSARIVKYQDPEKPSHHRFDLGAASDICVHDWVEGRHSTLLDLYAPPSVASSPIGLAHGIEYLDVPYSRLITYSESPYLCLAVSAQEVEAERPRKAFYENRYTGVPKVKPDYRQYSSPQARNRAFEQLQNQVLEHDWRGAGYPTYHGGGFRQYHHMRVSKYTMVSDWLFDLKSISTGAKNVPSLDKDSVQDAFAAAGIIYDWMIGILEVHRLSIVKGYVSHLNPHFDEANDWRGAVIMFSVVPPGDMGVPLDRIALEWNTNAPDGASFAVDGEFITAVVNVEEVLSCPD